MTGMGDRRELQRRLAGEDQEVMQGLEGWVGKTRPRSGESKGEVRSRCGGSPFGVRGHLRGGVTSKGPDWDWTQRS